METEPLDLLPPDGAAELAALAATLVPGGDGWPAADAIGVQGLLATRLSEEQGEEALAALLVALEAAGGPLAPLDEAGRTAVLQRLERSEPDLFGWVRDAVFIAYYESPFTAAAINAKGHPYRLRPHLSGYRVPRFDPALHAPKERRGRYIPTDEVRPVDLGGLDLATSRTARWGRSR